MNFKAKLRESLAERFSLGNLRRTILVLFGAFLCLHILKITAFCVPACPEAVLYSQPDGTPFWARKVGDEHSHFIETDTGYTIIRDVRSGKWFYAATDAAGMLEKSPFLVGKVLPHELGMRKHLRSHPDSELQIAECQLRLRKDQIRNPQKGLLPDGAGAAALYSHAQAEEATVPSASASMPAATGSIKSLVIPACFLGDTIYFPRDDLDDLFNEPGYSAEGAAGSVRDYYLDVSAGQLTVNATVADWVLLPRPELFYGANDPSGNDSSPWQLVRDALQALDSKKFDFRPFDGDGDGAIDMLIIVHSGLGEEYLANPPDCVWSQVVKLMPPEIVDGLEVNRVAIVPERRYNTTSIGRIGVICHEMGHLLGLPDLYDTDGSSSGIGVWGVMAAGSWGGDGHSPERPVHFCCWSKVNLGWIEPTEIDASSSPVSVPGIEKAGSWGVQKVSCEMADGEYLLIENRRKSGYDLKLPGAGLLIWHVDDNLSRNDDESHYMLALLQADGANNLEAGSNRGDTGDPFPGSSNNRSLDDKTSPGTASYYNEPTHVAISNISDSSLTMTFEISTLTDIFSEDFSKGLPGKWEIVDGGDDGYTWTDDNPGSREDPNWSGKFMIVDSDAAGWRSMDEKLLSPQIDCSLYVHTYIKFSHYFQASSGQTGDVSVRVDGGKWQNVACYKINDDSGTENIDISSYADGRSSVQVRWRFYNIQYGWYWGIDDVALRGELPENAPPELVITSVSQRRDGSGRIEIQFIGTDLDNDSANWAPADCQYAASPLTTWQPLELETTDPANTAVEPMPFTSQGRAFVAVVDASSWEGTHKVRLRVTDEVTSRPAVLSDEFAVDNTPPVIATPTHLDQNPLSGAAFVTARSEWNDSNPDITWFRLSLNGGAWGEPLQGVPSGEASQAATFASLSLDGDDHLAVKSLHVDELGNQSEKSVSPAYYAAPLTPGSPSVRNSTPNSLVVVVTANFSERGDVDYAVYCLTASKHLDWGTGELTELPVWGDYAQWGSSAGTTVGGLETKTSYAFQVLAANPLNHDSRSQLSPTGSATTGNTPPNRPESVVVSPEHPASIHDLVCNVTPASPVDDDAEDTVSYRFTWSCPGIANVVHGPKAALSDVLPSENTRKGQTWTCAVQAYDSWEYGPSIQASVLIGNVPPCRVSSVSLVPASPRTSDDIICLISPALTPDTDPADVVTYRYTWTRIGGQPIVHGPTGAFPDSLASHWTTKDDSWTCTVEAYDGTDYGPPLAKQVLVVNTRPSVEILGQRAAYSGQSIHLDIVSSDADGDATTIICESIPPGAVFSRNGEDAATFFWANPSADLRREVTFSASDGSEETEESVLLTFSQTPFEVCSVGKTDSPPGEPVAVITWYALPGMEYSIRRSTDLLSWTLVAGSLSLPEDSDVPDWLTYRDEISAVPSLRCYYRLGM